MSTSAPSTRFSSAEREALDIDRLGPPQGAFTGRDAAAAIRFALGLDDPYECQDFLRSWDVGDTREWPEFRPDIAPG